MQKLNVGQEHQTSAGYLVYFWMPISLGMERGRMMTRHTMKSEKRWSVYQWYGISPSVDPVMVSYKEMQTGGKQARV